MWLIIGFVVIVAVLAFILSRRGSTGMSTNGSTDTVEGTLGQSLNKGSNGFGGGAGF